MSFDKESINIIGAGLTGLSAAITLARAGRNCNLISMLPSERAQSVMAEGGINGALNTMGEDDCTENHFNDTMKAGVYIADEEAVRGFAERAPKILMELKRLGVPFNLQNEQIQQRNFGGQKKKRTAYARSSTGKRSRRLRRIFFLRLSKSSILSPPYIAKSERMPRRGIITESSTSPTRSESRITMVGSTTETACEIRPRDFSV